MTLGYLPYAEEKSWDDVILTPTQQLGMERVEGLPLYSAAVNMALGNTENTKDLPAGVRYFIGVPSALGGALVDGVVGMIGNTAVNGYKRLYNDAATLYNLGAANVNHGLEKARRFMTQKELNKRGRNLGDIPQQSQILEMAPVSQPKPLPADGLTPAPRKDGLKPVQQNNNDVKKIIVDALQKLQNNGGIAKNVEAAKKLIDLYKVATSTTQTKQEVKPKQFLVGTDGRMIAEIVD